jgi:hypothetical protein
MLKQTHYYIATSKADPDKIRLCLKNFLPKEPNINDDAKNLVYNILNTGHKQEKLTLTLSKTGKVTFYTHYSEEDTLNIMKEFLNESIYEEIKNNWKPRRTEERRFDIEPISKSGYFEYVYNYGKNPSPLSKLQEMERVSKVLDLRKFSCDMKILRFLYNRGFDQLTTKECERFDEKRQTFRRNLDKLWEMRLLDKIGKRDVIYIPLKDDRRRGFVHELIKTIGELNVV